MTFRHGSGGFDENSICLGGIYRSDYTCDVRDCHGFAATSPAMQACSKQWSDMKKANKVPEGEKWSEFWSQCSKDYAAKNGGDTGAGEAVSTEKTTKPKKTAAVSEDDSASSAQQKKDCDSRWDANKTKTGAHGWHDYFQFMAKCM